MKTLVIGASPNPERFSHKAVKMLLSYNHEVFALGKRSGKIKGLEILKGKPELDGIDTVSLYLGAKNQREYYEYILLIKPRRIIFNPGTENQEFMDMAEERGIEVIPGCTLVMLRVGNY